MDSVIGFSLLENVMDKKFWLGWFAAFTYASALNAVLDPT
jgi:hypothetical protein